MESLWSPTERNAQKCKTFTTSFQQKEEYFKETIGIIGLSFQLDSINVKNLSVSTDVQTLARQIVSQCSQIQPSRLPEVEQLLRYLQTRAGDKWGEG